MCVYYIIEGTIYQAPNLCTVLSNRIKTSLYHLQQAFDLIQTPSDYSPFYPHQHYLWNEQKEAYIEYKTKDPIKETSESKDIMQSDYKKRKFE